jgi:GPH family glycoside/pentoside/hexuronide:cation symporter
MPQMPGHTPISPIEKIGYGLGDTASNIVFQTVMLLLAYFYTDIFGISAAAMGTLFLSVRFMDAVTDPIMGVICDRTVTRWGKFRPYLLWLCVPFAIICVVTFTTPDLDPAGKLIYAYVTYGLLMLVYTAINIPYCALGGVMTPDTHERVSLNSYRFFLATAGGVLVASATLPLVELLGGGNDQKGYQLAMVIFGVLAVCLFLACFVLTRERVVQITAQPTSLRQDIRVLLTNDQWVVLAGLTFILLIPIVIRSSAAAYYIKWYAGRKDLITLFLTTGMVAAMIGAAAASPLTRRVSKVKAYILIQAVIFVVSAAMYFVRRDQLILMFVLFGIVQFFVQMGSPILWAMMADTVDYGEYKTGRRITGLVFSGTLFTLKMGVALGGAIFGWILGYFGYQKVTETLLTQTDSAIKGIALLFTLIPAGWHLLVIAAVTRYKLSEARCDDIRAELDRRKQLSDSGPDR